MTQGWRKAVEVLGRLTGRVTSEQRALAAFIGLKLPDELPAIVAGALLQGALSNALAVEGARPSTTAQKELLKTLGDEDTIIYPSTLERREANAWIQFFWLRSRQRALAALELDVGDIVTVPEAEGDLLYEVASIGDNGCVHFRGGLGRRAWPDRLMVVCRRNDSDDAARGARSRAENQAAARTRADSWSLAKQNELRDFEIKQHLTRDDINLFRATILSARDEKPIQRLVQSRPQLLTCLLGGSPTFCIPQARLGAEHVTDFLISDIDSRGVRWILVELETPRSAVTLQNTKDLDQFARKGVSQVKEWRDWLQNNLSKARRFRREGGLGLADIRPNADGLVIVGRRELLHEGSPAVRDRLREESRIDVRTYDWWLARVEGAFAYSGPSASSPYALRRPEDDAE